MRQGLTILALTNILFQSTHPLRDATRTVQTTTAEGSISIHAPLTGCDEEDEDADEWEEISIHAPLTGCDLIPSALDGFSVVFQSTHPLRDATSTASVPVLLSQISIHAPLTGCDTNVQIADNQWNDISIHAPLTGCDIATSSSYAHIANFNPRTPYGMRQKSY